MDLVPDLHHPADAVSVAVIALRQILQRFQPGMGHVVFLLGII